MSDHPVSSCLEDICSMECARSGLSWDQSGVCVSDMRRVAACARYW